MQHKKAEVLLNKLLDGTISEEELTLLETWYMRWNPVYANNLSEADILAAVNEMRATLKPSPVRKLNGWLRYAVASVILLLVGASIYLLINRATLQPAPLVTANEIQPASKKATLTLDDGAIIQLSDTGSRIFSAGGTAIAQSGSVLSYQQIQIAESKSVYHTLSTPKGGLFETTLQDGTKVWLNTASSLRYPVCFDGPDRIVELTGEAYFEVAQDKNKVFRVKMNEMEVEVLGTHFNVNAFRDKGDIETTLLQGSVRVKSNSRSALLKPGEQGRLSTTSVTVSRDVNVSDVMAWKNGLFNFNQKDISAVMNQLSRWYDIEVQYPQGQPEMRFFGEIERGLTLKSVLAILEKSNVKFELNGKKLVVYP